MKILFKKKYFFFRLAKSVTNSRKQLISKKGWIIKLENNEDNKIGFGEVSPLYPENLKECEKDLALIPDYSERSELIKQIKKFHPCVQSGLNTALAELKGELVFDRENKFDRIHQSAILCDSENILDEIYIHMKKPISISEPITLKWKVGIKDRKSEELLLEEILNRINKKIRLRIDPNGTWNREVATRWADILKDIHNLDWLEQPLSEDDLEGLNLLQKKIPVALDESLLKHPHLINKWNGWQIRRPSQEKNPITLLKELENKKAYRSISTSFETGIGRRIINQLAFLQLKGPTPKVPGLALKQTPKTSLFSNNSELIWDKL